MSSDNDGVEEEERTPSDEDETPAKKSKALKGKKTKQKETAKEIKVDVEEAEAEVEAHGSELARETPAIQAQVDEQIKAEMQEDVDDQAFEADMFRMD